MPFRPDQWRATISVGQILGRVPKASPGLLRPLGRPEHHVGPQRRDLMGAQPGQQVLADAVLVLGAEGIDGGQVAGPEHHIPEPVRMLQVMLAGRGHHGRVRHPGPGEQPGQGRRGGDLVPRVEGLDQAGSTSPTQRQKWLLAGSNNPGPQVVTATTPPGRTRRQISRRNAVISAAKNTPKTQTNASKPPSGSLVRVASPDRELDVGQPFVRRPGPGQLKQRRRHIYAEHTPRGSHGAGSRDRRRPGAAAQVEHHAAGRQPQPRHRRGAEPVPEAQRGLPVVIGRGSVGASRPLRVRHPPRISEKFYLC